MAIAANTKVLTLDYWKRAEQLKPGDWVFDKEGKPVQIKSVQHFYSEDCYAVIFNDKHYVIGDKHLSFLLENEQYRKRLRQYKMVRRTGFTRPLKKYNIEQLLEVGLKGRANRTEFSLPSNKPLNFPHQDLPIPPFVFGFWYMNRRNNKILSVPDDYKEEVFQKFKDYGYMVEEKFKNAPQSSRFIESPNIERQLIPNVPTKIPTNYILAHIDQRKELLSAIIYAKKTRYNPKTDRFIIRSYDPEFILQMQCIVESLGDRTTVLYYESQEYYELRFKSKHRLIHNQTSKPVKVHHDRRFIVEIRPVQPQMVIHIETLGLDNTIAVAEGFISVC